MDRRKFLQTGVTAGALSLFDTSSSALPLISGADDREYWVQLLTTIGQPVLSALSQRKLKALMPVEAPHGNVQERRQFTHLEAFGRLLAGIAPWLESGASDGGKELFGLSMLNSRERPSTRRPTRHRQIS